LVRTLVAIAVAFLVLGGLLLLLRPDTLAAGPQDRRFDVSIEDGEMSPREISVDEGDRVTLSLESDEPVEVHLHGYDVERDAGPGQAAELYLEADLTGRFGIEDHGTGEDLGVLQVRPR
jgi:FtsP/CotA-like multicopper oxidase with cupredoxin domain